MDKADNVSLQSTEGKLFRTLLLLYPKSYRRRFGEEMALVFRDMCQEEMATKGYISTGFLLTQYFDMTKNIIDQHIREIQKQGMKKYLQHTWSLNTYNVIGIILMLPVLVVFGIDLVSRLVQHDLIHYNRATYAFLSHTFLYQFPVLFTWAIIFPTLALVINVISILLQLAKRHTKIFSVSFILHNIISLLVLFLALGFLAIVRLHDFAPCMVHGILKVGFGQISHIIAVCRNA